MFLEGGLFGVTLIFSKCDQIVECSASILCPEHFIWKMFQVKVQKISEQGYRTDKVIPQDDNAFFRIANGSEGYKTVNFCK